MKSIFTFLFLLAMLGLSVFAAAVEVKAGPYTVDLRTDPAVIPVGRATLIISVKDSSGNPVSSAKIRAIAQMPGMPMGEREGTAVPDPAHPGTYSMPAQFAMAGTYEVRLSIEGPKGNATAVIPLQTGESTAGAASQALPWGSIAIWALLGLALIFVLFKMRRTGQRFDLRPIAKRSVITSLIMLAALVALSVYVVNHFRRPGSMTPVEAQVMQMDMPAPEGTSPVQLATALFKPFTQTVNYTGQAAGFVEQDVNPRVSGVIQWMPFYVGNRVQKGQVLARLDTSQLLPELTAKQASAANAREGIQVARTDYQQAQAMASEGEAELGSYEAGVEQAKADAVSAGNERDAAQASVSAADADLQSAQAMVSAARADISYWHEEMARESVLLQQNAVSLSEYQKEKAEADKAEANYRQAGQSVIAAQAKLTAAKANARKASSAVASAQKKISQAQAQLMAHHAHVRGLQAAAQSSRQKIAQSQTVASGAEADLSAAAAQRGYAEIRSEIDGVITQRLISPGVLVSPGQTILKVAQLAPIRLQANVAEADLSRIKIGNRVFVKLGDSYGKGLVAHVTSISPSLDPTSRTGVVEALLANADSRILPGAYVSMQIEVGRTGSRLVVPSAAVQITVEPSASDVNSSRSSAYVWVAQPVSGQGQQYTVHRVNVVTGDQSSNFTEIKTGLSAGDQVITAGATYLSDGQTVTANGPETSARSGSVQTIRVTSNGFDPTTITLLQGSAHKVTFLRTTDQTCATEIVFPSIKIRKSLPLNVPVTIDLPPSVTGRVSFACGMNMFKGEVVLQ